jgi:hypothetical protein
LPLVFQEYDPKLRWSIQDENKHTVVHANGADSIFNVSGQLPGVHTDNVVGVPLEPMLVDPLHRNFRPKGGSALHNMGAGAYTSVGDYWIPGQQSHLASHPIPAHGGVMDCTGVDCWVELMWRAAFDATDHRLFVLALNESTVSEHAGISEENERLSATEDAALSLMMQRHVLRRPNPEVVVTLKSASVAGRHQLPIPLGGGTFLWRVDAVEMDGQTVRQGQTWRFTAHR